jgi:hypothetical protein
MDHLQLYAALVESNRRRVAAAEHDADAFAVLRLIDTG